MDKKIIEQYGEDILSYRFRSARNNKRAQREDFDKHLIGLHKEGRALSKKNASLGWEPLVPPIQKGWKRSFILRPDIARGRHGFFFAGILEKINACKYNSRKDFLERKGRGRWKKWTSIPQQLRDLDRTEFEKLTDKEKEYFHPEARIEKWRREPVVRYAFNDPWMFVLKTAPNYIDKVRIGSSELEQRMDEIDHYIERNELRGRQWKLIHGTSWKRARYVPDDRIKYSYKNWPLQRILEATKDEVYNE